MNSKHEHVPTVSEVADEVVERLQNSQKTPQIGLGVSFNSPRESTWDKILKYALLPATPFMVAAALAVFINFNGTLIKIEVRLDNIERRFDATENKINDHEARIRVLERK